MTDETTIEPMEATEPAETMLEETSEVVASSVDPMPSAEADPSTSESSTSSTASSPGEPIMEPFSGDPIVADIYGTEAPILKRLIDNYAGTAMFTGAESDLLKAIGGRL